MLDTEREFPIKQKPFSVLSKKTNLFLTMAVPIEWMIRCNEENEKNYLGAWKIKQKKLNAMRAWKCRQGKTLLVPIHPCFYAFQFSSVLSEQVFCSRIHWCIQNPAKHLKWSLLREYLWEKTFCWKPIIFDDFRRRGSAKVMNSLKIT